MTALVAEDRVWKPAPTLFLPLAELLGAPRGPYVGQNLGLKLGAQSQVKQ